MKSTKGFTLIELLAVIVILAIIALIATPIVLNLIEDARKGAAKSNMYGYIDSTEKAIMASLVDDDTTDYSGTYVFSTASGATTADLAKSATADTTALTIKVKGTLPDSGVADSTIVVGNNGEVTLAEFRFNGKYYVTYTYTNNTTKTEVNTTSFAKNSNHPTAP